VSLDLRQLGPEDLVLMHGLLAAFGAAFGDMDSYGGKRPGADDLRRLLDGSRHLA
jgi:hypothetical protein